MLSTQVLSLGRHYSTSPEYQMSTKCSYSILTRVATGLTRSLLKSTHLSTTTSDLQTRAPCKKCPLTVSMALGSLQQLNRCWQGLGAHAPKNNPPLLPSGHDAHGLRQRTDARHQRTKQARVVEYLSTLSTHLSSAPPRHYSLFN